MATDYGEKEREFLDGLKESTGRDLAEWMTAIAEKDLPHRNDIIDWLRHQGFMFSQASWLERIHHNGGRPIYADSAAGNLMATRLPRERAANDTQPPTAPIAAVEPEPDAQPPEPLPRPAARSASAQDDDLAPVLAKAKAYRPLAQHVLAKIKDVRSDTRCLARGSAVAMAAPDEFAVLAITGKELRLHLALGEDDDGGDIVKKAPPPAGLGKGAKLTHMIVLTDARQIDGRLLDVVARAATKVNGG